MMVGDAQVPLLRIVPVAGRDEEMMSGAFDHIQYCPLLSLSAVKCHHHASSLEWYFDSGVVPYIYFNGLKAS
jgi:hypothetical protein